MGWNKPLELGIKNQIAKAQGFQRSSTEHTRYKKMNREGELLLVCIYVDDVMSSSN